jgi:hypothetical protein
MITEKTYLEAQKIVDAYNEQLRITDVVGRSEQLPICKCENTERQDYGDGWNITCLDCGKNW